MPTTLQSAHLELGAYLPSDEDRFVDLFQDRMVSRWMGDGTSPEEEDRALFRRILTDIYPTDRFDVWAVRLGGQIIGHAELKPSKTVTGHELIYALAPAWWGKGLGTELAGAICHFGFGIRRLTNLYATVHEDNAASMSVLRRLGFRVVNTIPNDDGYRTIVFLRSTEARSASSHVTTSSGQGTEL